MKEVYLQLGNVNYPLENSVQSSLELLIRLHIILFLKGDQGLVVLLGCAKEKGLMLTSTPTKATRLTSPFLTIGNINGTARPVAQILTEPYLTYLFIRESLYTPFWLFRGVRQCKLKITSVILLPDISGTLESLQSPSNSRIEVLCIPLRHSVQRGWHRQLPLMFCTS